MKKDLKYKIRRVLFLYIPFIVFWDAILIYGILN